MLSEILSNFNDVRFSGCFLVFARLQCVVLSGFTTKLIQTRHEDSVYAPVIFLRKFSIPDLNRWFFFALQYVSNNRYPFKFKLTITYCSNLTALTASS